MRDHLGVKALILGIFLSLFAVMPVRADEVYGRIRGVVMDATGAVVPGAKLHVTNLGTNVGKDATSKSDGSFEFIQLLAPGTYAVSAEASGFKKFSATGIRLSVGQIWVQNVNLEVGTTRQEVVVEAAPTQVERTSIELGANLTTRDMTELPLIGRNWVQLQATLPGMVGNSDRFAANNFASNGSRSQFNDFRVNGTDNNDFTLNLVLTTPSPDSIGEVNIVTNTINPEYGRNSGAILNAVTKSGTNSFHGDGFDFFRDTSLNTRNFFQPSPAIFHQNEFGGTVGGPVWKNHTFFFFSYQGIRAAEPDPNGSGRATVFTPAQRNGIFTDVPTCTAAGLACASPFPLVGESGATFPAGTQYSTIFPTGHIPSVDLNSIAVKLMNQYVPLPNSGTEYDFDPTRQLKQDQEIIRIDHTFSPRDAIWGYSLIQRNPYSDTLPFSGATVPGFTSVSQDHIFEGTLAWNHTFGGSALNEARFGYNRNNFVSNIPVSNVLPSSLGFNISPQAPQYAQVPIMNLTGYFEIGFSNNGPQPRITPTYEVTDNFSWIHNNHAFKVGFEMRRMEVYNPFYSSLDGNYQYAGAGSYSTGEPGADYLLGIPDTYAQNSGDIMNVRARTYGAYFQDQYKFRPNLTVTYGVNWDDETPSTDLYHNGEAINCWIPGQQSKIFPTAPLGLDYPGDSGCSSSGYSNHPAHFGPKLGFAWSPGSSAKTSIRGGYGIYFNRTEEELTLQNLGAPPWGLSSTGVNSYISSTNPGFANPWADIAGNGSHSNPFPYANPAVGSHYDFSQLGIFYVLNQDQKMATPYAENFNLTVQRELPGNLLFSVGYVGSVGRKLDTIYNTNFDVNPAGCLAGVGAEAGCAANRTYQKLFYPQNARYAGTPNTGVIGIGNEATFLTSNYSSMQMSLTKRAGHGLSFNAAYTWAHNLDYASSLEDDSFGGLALDPTNFASNYGNAGTDARHRFTVSYVYDFPKVKAASNNFVLSRVVNGWEMAGVTSFQTGFPVQIYESTYRELRCDGLDWTVCPDRPNQVGPVGVSNPRNTNYLDKNGTQKGNYWFNPRAYALEPIGSVGNVGRNPIHGPGINNFNWSLYKNIPIVGESKYIQLRFEFYNIWNHTQFNAIAIQSLASNFVNGNAASSNFGRVNAAFDPRLIQLAAKIYF